jgi:uncharacterized protein YecE (DUF72 family)
LPIAIGTAGWTIPRAVASEFPGEGAHLERYSRRFQIAEINSSFHRPHRLGTYARWAASVPDGFRFAVKLPKQITHTSRLVDVEPALDQFAAETAGLSDRFGPVLVQLPPKLAFDAQVASAFLASLRLRFPGPVACEPRHASWFAAEADSLLRRFEVARVAADPARVPEAAEPGGWPGLVYYRLHGSPRTYYSAYSRDYLERLGRKLHACAAPVWCIFDNTASGAAAGDALALSEITGQ